MKQNSRTRQSGQCLLFKYLTKLSPSDLAAGVVDTRPCNTHTANYTSHWWEHVWMNSCKSSGTKTYLIISQPAWSAVRWSSLSWWWMKTASSTPPRPGPMFPPEAWWRSWRSAERQCRRRQRQLAFPPCKQTAASMCSPQACPAGGAALPLGGWWACCTKEWRPKHWASGRCLRWPPRAGNESAHGNSRKRYFRIFSTPSPLKEVQSCFITSNPKTVTQDN